MRRLASIVIGFALIACEAPPAVGPGPVDPPLDELPPEVLSVAHELTLPAVYASAHELLVYAELDGERASELSELSYGLAEGYPRRIEVTADDAFILDDACRLAPGAVVWRSIVDVQGSAAGLEIVDGALVALLREEGTVTALLDGELVGQECTFADGVTVTTIPLQHRVEMRVHRVAGFAVETFDQVVSECWDSLVLPSDAPLSAPTAIPVDAMGQRFAAMNAPTPVAITLRSEGALTPTEEAGRFQAGPGAVTVEVDTTLPVSGLRSFAVVGPDALTAVEAGLYLQRAAAKGSELIEDEGSYQVFFPEMRNTVNVRVDEAMTARGRLCANVPAPWFASSSATPGQCAAGEPEELSAGMVPVATIRSEGECRLEVTMPGTSHAWHTRFRTTL